MGSKNSTQTDTNLHYGGNNPPKTTDDVAFHDPKKYDYFVDESKGIALPYELSEHSEHPAYIELVVDNGDNTYTRERYAINSNTPDHECKVNCMCLKKLDKYSDDPDSVLDRGFRNSETSSCKTDTLMEHLNSRNGINSETSPNYMKQSDDNPVTSKIPWRHKYSETSPLKPDTELNSQNGKNSVTSPNYINPVDSPLHHEKSPMHTDTIAILGLKGGKRDDEDYLSPLESSDDDDNDASTSTDESSTTSPKKKKTYNKNKPYKKKMVNEDGIVLGNSSVNSSDLYRMQGRLFKSLTTTESEFENQVNGALDMMDRNKNKKGYPFSSEDNMILNMQSSEPRKPRKFKTNPKYS